MGQHLSFGNIVKAEWGKPESPTGLGKSGRPGWNGGLAETWVMVELGTRRTIERVRVGNSPPNAACAALLSQAPFITFIMRIRKGLNRRLNFFLYRLASFV